VLSQLPPRIIKPVLRGQVLGFQILEQISQRLILGHWTTTAQDMEQRRQLNEFAAAFAYHCIPHHLQHRVRLSAHKQLLVLDMLTILVPVGLPLLRALLWQIHQRPSLSHVLLEIVPFWNNQLRLPIDRRADLAVDRHKHSFAVEVRLRPWQFRCPDILELPI
jgi:hypothetical protein